MCPLVIEISVMFWKKIEINLWQELKVLKIWFLLQNYNNNSYPLFYPKLCPGPFWPKFPPLFNFSIKSNPNQCSLSSFSPSAAYYHHCCTIFIATFFSPLYPWSHYHLGTHPLFFPLSHLFLFFFSFASYWFCSTLGLHEENLDLRDRAQPLEFLLPGNNCSECMGCDFSRKIALALPDCLLL